MSSRIWNAAPRKKPKRSIGSRSTAFLAPINAPTRSGSSVVYQHVFWMIMSR